MPVGTVKWFNKTKGYGFIVPDGGGDKDVFVHITEIEKAGMQGLNEGQRISFSVMEAQRGLKAVEIKPAS
ncbi:MAG: cold-shock protein [Alphaproteobacteria bacterium]|nr:cold-shock protein [Alphaproteobacteria bacterium]